MRTKEEIAQDITWVTTYQIDTASIRGYTRLIAELLLDIREELLDTRELVEALRAQGKLQ